MKKYLTTIKLFWQQYLIYRFNFVLWRIRNIFLLLALYFLWTSAFAEKQVLFNYTQTQIVTYILLVTLFRALVVSTRSTDIVGQIHSGDLSNLLVKPISVINYYFARDMADKIFNIFFSVLEVGLFYLLVKPNLVINTSPTALSLTAVALLLAFIFNFYLNFLIGLWGFWAKQVWPILFVSRLFSDLISGGLFPLDILPPLFTQILHLTPFPYLLFYPANIYLGRIAPQQALLGFGVIIFWTVVAYFGVRIAWRKGTKNYEAFGN